MVQILNLKQYRNIFLYITKNCELNFLNTTRIAVDDEQITFFGGAQQ